MLVDVVVVLGTEVLSRERKYTWFPRVFKVTGWSSRCDIVSSCI